jgi:hypothetical protein
MDVRDGSVCKLQTWDGTIFVVEQLMPMLRRQIRHKLGIEEVPLERPIGAFEELMIYRFCYILWIGSSGNEQMRHWRTCSDRREFRSGREGLPEYMIRLLQVRVPWDSVPQFAADAYRMAVEIDGSLPDSLDADAILMRLVPKQGKRASGKGRRMR